MIYSPGVAHCLDTASSNFFSSDVNSCVLPWYRTGFPLWTVMTQPLSSTQIPVVYRHLARLQCCCSWMPSRHGRLRVCGRNIEVSVESFCSPSTSVGVCRSVMGSFRSHSRDFCPKSWTNQGLICSRLTKSLGRRTELADGTCIRNLSELPIRLSERPASYVSSCYR